MPQRYWRTIFDAEADFVIESWIGNRHRSQNAREAPQSAALLRPLRLQRQRMKLPAHLSLEGAIDELVLLHPVLAVERR